MLPLHHTPIKTNHDKHPPAAVKHFHAAVNYPPAYSHPHPDLADRRTVAAFLGHPLAMNQQAAANYLRTKVLTATPEQLQLMLYDGALRFCDQAKAALLAKNFEQSYTLITKAQKIVVELTSSLRHDLSPDLCGKLAAIYTFAYRKLIDANINHELLPLEEAVNLLRYQRETWVLLMQQMQKTKAGAMAKTLDLPAPSARMEASISMQG